MSYQRIATPRAYLDLINPLLEKGVITGTDQITGTGLLTTASSIIQLFDNKPNNTITIGGNGTNTQQTIVIDTNVDNDGYLLAEPMFVAILGHNLKTADAKFKIETDDASDFSSAQSPTLTSVCNGAFASNYSTPATDGWSLVTFTQAVDNRYHRIVIDSASGNYDDDIKIGAILYGTTYTFPNSPDINIKKSFVYNGVKVNESLGGQKYAHATHLTNSDWVSTSPWSSRTETSLKTGRIKLNMSFSFLSDDDIFSSNLYRSESSQTDDNLVPKLLYLTNGGMFPFLFQYDKDTAIDNDSFLWCRIDNDVTFNQVSNNVYSTDISLIEEF